MNHGKSEKTIPDIVRSGQFIDISHWHSIEMIQKEALGMNIVITSFGALTANLYERRMVNAKK